MKNRRGIYLADTKDQHLAEALPGGMMLSPFVGDQGLYPAEFIQLFSQDQFLKNGKVAPDDDMHWKKDPTYNMRRNNNESKTDHQKNP